MEKHSAISIRRSAKTFAAIALLCLTPSLIVAAPDANARFSTLGHKMICACGCNQILLECNHVGCPLSDGMRNQLASALQRGDSDDLVLQAFVQQYGPTILAAPTNTGFNRVAWVMPFVVLLVGFGSAVLIARRWKSQSAAISSQPQLRPSKAASRNDFEDEVRRETEL